MTTAPDAAPPHSERWRAIATRAVGILGGLPAVRTLVAVLTTYDRAGGGLIASGLAYAALIALLPGMLLVLSIFALVISDAATRERIVSLIAEAVPPLEDVVRTAFEQVSSGAVPTGIIAFIGLLWGASRFYAALDYSFTRVFHTSRARNEIQRTLRGVLLVGAVVLLPLVALLAGTLVGWIASLMDEPPDLPGLLNGDLALALHIASYVMFVGVVLLVVAKERDVRAEPRIAEARAVAERQDVRLADIGRPLANIEQGQRVAAPDSEREPCVPKQLRHRRIFERPEI